MIDPVFNDQLYRAMEDVIDDVQFLIGVLAARDDTDYIAIRGNCARAERLLEEWRANLRREELAALRKAAERASVTP